MEKDNRLTQEQLKEILTKAQKEAHKIDNVTDFLSLIEAQVKRATGMYKDELEA
jgi:hypothetical protein